MFEFHLLIIVITLVTLFFSFALVVVVALVGDRSASRSITKLLAELIDSLTKK